MFSPSHLFRLLVTLVLSFSLIYGPLPSLWTARAESPVPSRTGPIVQPVLHPHRDGEMIVKFRDGVPQWQRDLIVQTFSKGETPLRGSESLSKLLIKDGRDLIRTLADLRQLNSIVEYAEPNYIVTRTGSFKPSSLKPGRFARAWALVNTGQNHGVPGADIGALAAWRRTAGSRETIVAVIDTGVDTKHPDLTGNLWVNQREARGRQNVDDDRDGYLDDRLGWNFIDNSPDVNDDHGHGTAVTGIIAAKANHERGVAGVMWQVGLMSLKALDHTGSGTISDVVEAMDYASAHGAAVINCSFGTEGYSRALLDAINHAAISGALVVASAGNDGRDLSQRPYYPASYTADNLIAVAASTNGDRLADFSNWGAGSVQIAAPGVDLMTTSPGGGYVSLTGTSAAAPLVTGVAGLLKTVRGWVSAQMIKRSLIGGARPSSDLSGKVASGGVVSAENGIEFFLKNDGGRKITERNGSGDERSLVTKGNKDRRPGRLNLEYLRNNRPHRGKPHPMATPSRAPSHKNYAPIFGFEGDPGAMTLPVNAAGRPSSTVGRVADPTVASSATGDQSIILGSQNANLTIPVVSFGGRGGEDLNLALSYNSNSVWVKDPYSNSLSYNGSGIGLHFGRLVGGPEGGLYYVPPIWNSGLGAYTYVWLEPDGTQRTLVGNASIENDYYRSNDSSHLEFEYHVEGGRNIFGVGYTGVLKLANGTRITLEVGWNNLGYVWNMSPREIKDRNGNFITIKNGNIVNPDGSTDYDHWVIDKVTDSVGREIDFTYENGRLKELRQNRNGTWQVFIRFTWTPITIHTNFVGFTAFPVNINGATVQVPSLIEIPDKVSYRFFYTSYGQAYQIEKWVPAIDGQGPARAVAFTWYDLPSINGQSSPSGAMRAASNNGGAQNRCPAFAIREEWAENWSRSEPGWVNSGGYPVARYTYTTFSGSGAGFSKVVDSIGRVYRTDTSIDGLTHTSRVWADVTSYVNDNNPGTPLKTMTTVYEQGGDGLRVKDVTITDGVYTRKTAIRYWTQIWVSLPDDITEYENGGSTVYRHTRIFYNTDATYTNRQIFGVVNEQAVYQGAGETTPWSSIRYFYDEPAYFDSTDFSVVQHDSTNYGTGLIAGRGNVTTVQRYNIGTGTWHDLSHTKYNKTGLTTAVTDAVGYTTQYFYEDNFSVPAAPPASRAQVTRVKDPDGYWSGAKYDWYTGLMTEAYHLAGTDGGGAHENVVTLVYDGLDRLTAVNQPAGHGGQTTYTYWDNWLATAVYTRLDAGKTYYGFTAFDGAGRVRWGGGDHPDGVSGKFWIRKASYDSVGRAVASTNPAAVDADYNLIDDDAAQGFLNTTVSYDALDRQLTLTRPDGSTIQTSYEGCGCAGSSTVTVINERGKKYKTVYDFLGRLKEAHNLTAAGATYSKAVYTHDGRNLLTKIEQYDGGSVHQDRILNYDGFGRLASQTTPEGGTLTYGYKANDWVDYVRNDRIVSGSTKYQVTPGYNGRGQITQVRYNDNDATPDVYYEYGEYGERTWMREKNDAGTTLASTQYGYDSYKRLQSETRVFQGLAGTFRVSYAYDLAGSLKQATYKVNTWEKNVYYDYSYGGALMKVGSDLTAGTTTENVAKDFNYRGFQALKNVTYGNGRRLTLGYDQKRLQLTSLQLKKTDGTDPIMNLNYDYANGGGGSAGNDGRLRRLTDNLDTAFSTDFGYDDHGRLASSTGTYQRNYTYDPWNNLTAVSGIGGEVPNYTLSYATDASGAPLNNRINNAGFSHDPAGNMLGDGAQSFTYDAANRLKTASNGASSYQYDGDGNRVRQASSAGTIYYLWSTVLNQPVVEITGSGSPQVYRAYVYSPGGKLMALQSHNGGFYWAHDDRLGSGRKLTDVNGAMVYRAEFDPHGQLLYEWSNGVGTNLNSHKFTGYERDPATNLDHAKARTYHHNRARFMQPDPMGLAAADLSNPQSLNLYSYVQNDPVNNTDPTGLFLYTPPRKEEPHNWEFDFFYGGGGWGGPQAVVSEKAEAVAGSKVASSRQSRRSVLLIVEVVSVMSSEGRSMGELQRESY